MTANGRCNFAKDIAPEQFLADLSRGGIAAQCAEFAAEAGSSICREILRGAGVAAGPVAAERTEGYYAARNSCERCIALAERIWLERHPKG